MAGAENFQLLLSSRQASGAFSLRLRFLRTQAPGHWQKHAPQGQPRPILAGPEGQLERQAGLTSSDDSHPGGWAGSGSMDSDQLGRLPFQLWVFSICKYAFQQMTPPWVNHSSGTEEKPSSLNAGQSADRQIFGSWTYARNRTIH